MAIITQAVQLVLTVKQTKQLAEDKIYINFKNVYVNYVNYITDLFINIGAL